MSSKKEYKLIELFDEINTLRNIFDSVELIDPINELKVICGEHFIRKTKDSCSKQCEIGVGQGKCICKHIVGSEEKYTMFKFTDNETYYILSRSVKVKGKTYVMIITSKITNNLLLGEHSSKVELVDSITKYSSGVYKDELTGAYNRKFIADNIVYILKKADNEFKNICVGCVDIDNFKQFNDKYGHSFGDKVLCEVTEVLKSYAKRKDDFVARLGGDEFILIVQDIEKKRFIKMMNDCCGAVGNLRLETDNGDIATVCISIGCSSTIEDGATDYKDLIDMADSKLYESKERGKNCAT